MVWDPQHHQEGRRCTEGGLYFCRSAVSTTKARSQVSQWKDSLSENNTPTSHSPTSNARADRTTKARLCRSARPPKTNMIPSPCASGSPAPQPGPFIDWVSTWPIPKASASATWLIPRNIDSPSRVPTSVRATMPCGTPVRPSRNAANHAIGRKERTQIDSSFLYLSFSKCKKNLMRPLHWFSKMWKKSDKGIVCLHKHMCQNIWPKSVVEDIWMNLSTSHPCLRGWSQPELCQTLALAKSDPCCPLPGHRLRLSNLLDSWFHLFYHRSNCKQDKTGVLFRRLCHSFRKRWMLGWSLKVCRAWQVNHSN